MPRGSGISPRPVAETVAVGDAVREHADKACIPGIAAASASEDRMK
ncbi:MAG: hypothetical protein R3C52_11715 [Hyphomonadaceae bacterium]